MSGSATSQGTRLFLNALFEADCVTSVGQPALSLGLTGAAGGPAVPVSGDFAASFNNSGPGPALEAYLRLALPAGVTATAARAAASSPRARSSGTWARSRARCARRATRPRPAAAA